MILSEYDRGDYMSDLFAHFPVAMWIIDAILWLLGIFFWGATYIGAPLESKKSGKHVSGFRDWLSCFSWERDICLNTDC